MSKTYKEYMRLINKRIQHNRKLKKQNASEKRGDTIPEDIREYDMYRFYGTVFPDSPFGQIVKKP